MKLKISILPVLLLVLAMGMLSAQEKKSRADVLYFEYSYADAIKEYQKEQQKKPLTNQQLLNLAHSYLKTGNYSKASESYLEVYKKDSTMSVHHFNDMLQAIAQTSGLDRVKAFLATKKGYLSPELIENAEFNFELLNRTENAQPAYTFFDLAANSPQSDFAPAFYKDRILFTSGRPQKSKQMYGPSGEAYLDIFIGRAGSNGDILNAQPYTGIPETEFHEATPSYSESLDKLFYIRSNTEGGRLTFDANGKNSLTLGVVNNEENFVYLLRDPGTSFYYPFYDEKNERLYFAANFDDGYGGTDLYYVHTNNGLIMSAPVNLGPRINTPGNEISPFIFENSLYYSSDIFYGLGGMDIYKSEIEQDGTYSIPVNLGKGINSEDDDFSLIIRNNDSGGLLGYYASNRPGGKGGDDIYGFEVAEKPGLKTLVFRGKALDANSGQGIAKVAVALNTMDGSLIKEVYTDEDGSYRIEIPLRDSLRLKATKSRYSRYSEVYGPVQLDSLKGGTKDIDLTLLDDLVRETEDQTVIKMDKFYFNKNKADITPEIATELDKVVRAVALFPDLQLRIESHTDSRGGSATNFRLSQNRADAIRDYLLGQGVPSSNILYSIGFGEDKIINNCTNGVYCLDILHKQNERQLIVVLNYDLLYE
jgi:outer membrane protein OmpA-like peptidoglycan-associated protein